MKLTLVLKSLGLHGGDAEQVLAAITGGLAARGHKVTVASFDSTAAADCYSFEAPIRCINLAVGNGAARARRCAAPEPVLQVDAGGHTADVLLNKPSRSVADAEVSHRRQRGKTGLGLAHEVEDVEWASSKLIDRLVQNCHLITDLIFGRPRTNAL